MMNAKACPRCRGNLYLDTSDGPAVFSCLQCGRSFQPVAILGEAAASQPATVAARAGRAA